MFFTQERKLPVNTLQQLQVRSSFDDVNSSIVSLTEHTQADSSASWLAVGGNALETIVTTWPEFSGLKEDIASGKGVLVASQSQALERVRAREGVYFLSDSESVRDIVFADYMTSKGPSEPLCSLTYTENFK